MKDKMKYIGIVGVLIGFIMSRILTSRYGNDGRVILASIAFIVLVISFIIIIVMKKYKLALLLLFIVFPCIVVFLGIIVDNVYIVGVGLILISIAIPIMIKIIPKLKDKYHF